MPQFAPRGTASIIISGRAFHRFSDTLLPFTAGLRLLGKSPLSWIAERAVGCVRLKANDSYASIPSSDESMHVRRTSAMAMFATEAVSQVTPSVTPTTQQPSHCASSAATHDVGPSMHMPGWHAHSNRGTLPLLRPCGGGGWCGLASPVPHTAAGHVTNGGVPSMLRHYHAWYYRSRQVGVGEVWERCGRGAVQASGRSSV